MYVVLNLRIKQCKNYIMIVVVVVAKQFCCFDSLNAWDFLMYHKGYAH